MHVPLLLYVILSFVACICQWQLGGLTRCTDVYLQSRWRRLNLLCFAPSYPTPFGGQWFAHARGWRTNVIMICIVRIGTARISNIGICLGLVLLGVLLLGFV